MRHPNKFQYDKEKEKGIMFFSAGSPKDCEMLLDAGITEILVSYFYLRKRKRAFEEEILPEIKRRGGLFMTDSGGFSFIEAAKAEKDTAKFEKEEYWLPYLNEYVQWLHDFQDQIYVSANLDLDAYLGRDKIDKWNSDYFKSLEKMMNVTYVAHRDWDKIYADYNGLKRVREYAEAHQYIGVNQNYKDYSRQVYNIARKNNNRVHGFAWTSIPILKQSPFFSVDSTTWLGGTRYGTTYHFDGKNFRVIDYKNKHLRKTKKPMMKRLKIPFEKLMLDNPDAVNQMNLEGWKGARSLYLSSAKRLNTRAAAFYEK